MLLLLAPCCWDRVVRWESVQSMVWNTSQRLVTPPLLAASQAFPKEEMCDNLLLIIPCGLANNAQQKK